MCRHAALKALGVLPFLSQIDQGNQVPFISWAKRTIDRLAVGLGRLGPVADVLVVLALGDLRVAGVRAPSHRLRAGVAPIDGRIGRLPPDEGRDTPVPDPPGELGREGTGPDALDAVGPTAATAPVAPEGPQGGLRPGARLVVVDGDQVRAALGRDPERHRRASGDRCCGQHGEHEGRDGREEDRTAHVVLLVVARRPWEGQERRDGALHRGCIHASIRLVCGKDAPSGVGVSMAPLAAVGPTCGSLLDARGTRPGRWASWPRIGRHAAPTHPRASPGASQAAPP